MQRAMGSNLHHRHSAADKNLTGTYNQMLHLSHKTTAQHILFHLLLSVAVASAHEQSKKLPSKERQRSSALSDLKFPKPNPEIQTTGDILVLAEHCFFSSKSSHFYLSDSEAQVSLHS